MIAGKIEALSVFKILRSVMTRKMTGTLRLESRDLEKRFVFFKGSVRLSYSNLPAEHLAPRLKDLGLISSIELQELKQSATYRNEQFADDILKKGLVTERRLSRIEGSLTRERLLQLFEWNDGTYEFSQDARTSELPSVDIDLTALIVEAAFIRTPFSICESFVVNLHGSQVLKSSGATSKAIEEALSDTWVYTQSLTGVSLEDVLSDPDNRHSNVRAAAAMILSGVGHLEKPAETTTTGPNATDSPKAPESAVLGSRPYRMKSRTDDTNADAGRKVVLKASAQAQATRSPKTRTTTSKPRAGAAPSPALDSSAKKAPRQRDDILKEVQNTPVDTLQNIPAEERERLEGARRLVEQAPKLNHYEILGVSKGATPESVRETFRRLAREYHADRFSRYDLPECFHQLIQLTFVTINASNEILGDPERRAEYDLELSLVSKGQHTRVRATRTAPQELNRALSAEREQTAALSCLCRGDVNAAKMRLAKGISFGLEGSLVSVLQIYINYLLELETGGRGLSVIQSRALDALAGFAKENDHLGEIYLFMGRIFKHQQDSKKAIAAFKKAVSTSPNLAEASSELRFLQRQVESQGKGLKGLLRS